MRKKMLSVCVRLNLLICAPIMQTFWDINGDGQDEVRVCVRCHCVRS
jgi:hypothetical protein